MSKDQEFKIFAVQRIITIASSRKSVELSFIKLYSKVTIIQRAHNKNRI